MAFDWKDEYSIKHPLIDSHHQHLFVLLDRLVEELANPVAVRETLQELKAYANYHFSVEENIMTATGNPMLAVHVADHQVFTNKIAELEARFDSDFQGTAEELVRFISSWFVNHILKIDRATFGASPGDIKG